MAVMHVRGVLVRVIQGFVAMDVRVLSFERWNVRMQVVVIVVPMHVLVLDRLVRVRMPVPLGDVEIHAEPEQARRCEREASRFDRRATTRSPRR